MVYIMIFVVTDAICNLMMLTLLALKLHPNND